MLNCYSMLFLYNYKYKKIRLAAANQLIDRGKIIINIIILLLYYINIIILLLYYINIIILLLG